MLGVLSSAWGNSAPITGHHRRNRLCDDTLGGMSTQALHQHPAWFGSVMGTAALSVAWGRVGPEFISTDPALAVSAVLIVVGALGAVALSVVWAAAQGRGVATLADVHGGWLIPPVMSLLVPLALAPQITAYPGQAE